MLGGEATKLKKDGDEDKMLFENLRKLAHKGYVEKGYEEAWKRACAILKPFGLDRLIDLAEVGLFGSEVAEAQEEVRDDDPEKEVKELAGLFIRMSNYAMRKGYDLEEAIITEAERNLTREHLHKRKII